MYGRALECGGFGRVSVHCEGLREGALWGSGLTVRRGCRGDGRAEGGDGGNGGFGSAGSLNAELGPEGPLLGQTVEGNAAMYVHDGFIMLATRGDWSSWSGIAGWGLLLDIISMGW